MGLGEEQETGFYFQQEMKWKTSWCNALWVIGSIPSNKIGTKEK